MKKIISLTLVMVIAIVTMGLLSCSSQTSSGQATDSGKNAAIEEVKDSLTTEIVGSYKAVKYEDGYVVNFEDMAYWYVEDGVVYILNGFAKTYSKNSEAKYGIEWEDLF